MVPSGIVRSHVTLVESTSKQHDPLVPSRPDRPQARSRARFASASVRACVCGHMLPEEKRAQCWQQMFFVELKGVMGKAQSCVFKCVIGARTMTETTDRRQ